jgi:hypothetical protein
MLPDDEKYLEEVLECFNVKKYRVTETPTRFKLILAPQKLTMKALHDIQTLRSLPVGVEVDVKSGVFVECLKSGSRRKRRRIEYEKFTGEIPEKYDVGKYNEAMRYILGLENICDFGVETGEKLRLKNLERISYAVLTKIESVGCDISFDMHNCEMILSL